MRSIPNSYAFGYCSVWRQHRKGIFVMEAAARDLLIELLETPSPSGYERPVQEVVRAYVADFADRVTTDLHGNVIAAKNPDAAVRVMFAGHCDQIGMLVSHIHDQGFLHAQTIG